jgi:protocatechuate 3,4-dioxygenase beta subunit
MEPELDRRSLLAAGGLLSLSAVLAACSGGSTGGGTPARSSSTAAPASPAPPSSAAAPTTAAPQATDLLGSAGTCVLTPTTIAGPTWFDADAVRTDIRGDRPGVPLDLAFRVERTPACTPLANAVVDLWQCDALGIYSGFAKAAPGQGGQAGGKDRYGDAESVATTAERWLRGTQVTGADGVVTFRSIYPGWYPTRTAHLHLKVHLDSSTVLTTQLFFDDAVSDSVYAGNDPYRQHPARDTRNARDPFYKPAGQLHLAPGGNGWLGAVVLGVR